MSQSKFCTECGNKITGSQQFCNNCGTKVNNPQSNNPKSGEKPKNDRNFFKEIGIIVIISLIIGSIVIFAHDNPHDSNSVNYPETLSELKSNYTKLETKINSTHPNDIVLDLELIKAKTAIEDVETYIKIGKPDDAINDKIKIAQEQINTAKEKYNKQIT